MFHPTGYKGFDNLLFDTHPSPFERETVGRFIMRVLTADELIGFDNELVVRPDGPWSDEDDLSLFVNGLWHLGYRNERTQEEAELMARFEARFGKLEPEDTPLELRDDQKLH